MSVEDYTRYKFVIPFTDGENGEHWELTTFSWRGMDDLVCAYKAIGIEVKVYRQEDTEVRVDV